MYRSQLLASVLYFWGGYRIGSIPVVPFYFFAESRGYIARNGLFFAERGALFARKGLYFAEKVAHFVRDQESVCKSNKYI